MGDIYPQAEIIIMQLKEMGNERRERSEEKPITASALANYEQPPIECSEMHAEEANSYRIPNSWSTKSIFPMEPQSNDIFRPRHPRS